MRRGALRLVLGALLLLACGTADEDVAEAVAEAPAEPCGPSRIAVTAVPPDSFTAADRCALVGLAMKMLGAAGEETGLLPSDTAAAMTALLVPVREMDPQADTAVAARWQVSLGLRGRPYDAELRVDRKTGDVRITRMHR